jgi:hypothetical protein
VIFHMSSLAKSRLFTTCSRDDMVDSNKSFCGVIDEELNILQRKGIAVRGPAVQVQSLQNEAANETFQLALGTFLNRSWP